MSNLNDVYNRGRAGFTAAMTETQAEYQRAEAAGDTNGQVAAAQALAGLRASLREFDALAQEEVQRTQPRRTSNELSDDEVEFARSHLTHAEREIARSSYSAPDISAKQKEQTYVRNKAKLQRMRASGEYPDRERN